MGEGRNKKIDGLRGLGAVLVAINHSFMVLRVPGWANVWGMKISEWVDWQGKLNQLVMLLGNGGLAVTIFFLISGLVLGKSWEKREMSFWGIAKFYGDRWRRLYPVYALMVVTVAVWMVLGWEYKSFAVASDWFGWWMNFEMDWKELWLNLSMQHLYVGGVTWTLRVVMVATIFFPAMYWINKRMGRWTDWLILAGLYWLPRQMEIKDFVDLNYVYLFYLGLMMPKWRQGWEKMGRAGAGVRVAVISALVIAWGIRYLGLMETNLLLEAAAAWWVVGMVVFGKGFGGFDFLEGRWWQFMGKISYEFYLTHFSVLYFLARMVLERGWVGTGNYFWWHLGLLTVSGGLSIFLVLAVGKLRQFVAGMSKGVGQVKVGVLR